MIMATEKLKTKPDWATQQSDPIWAKIREEVKYQVEKEPLLASFLHTTVLKHNSLEDTLSWHLAHKLDNATLPGILLREIIDEALQSDPDIGKAIRADLRAFCERDPSCDRYSLPLLYLKGFMGLQAYRIAHWLWSQDRTELALYMQGRVSEVFSMDIHPAAQIGKGIMIDHGTSLVIGETAVVCDNVSMLHEVTLGGTGKEIGDRHPKVMCGVLLGAGAKVLGNVKIGEGAMVGAGSVVLTDVPPHQTYAGVPAKAVGKPRDANDANLPAFEMDHSRCCDE
jgi:serine O-acetyltransferase